MSPHPRAIEPEDAAARFLKRQGLKIVERNFNTTLGEIDIVAVDGDVLVFVEVRSRSSDSPVAPQDTVNHKKQAKLRRAAEIYLKSHGLLDEADCRFDVVALTGQPDGGDWTIDHFVDAF